MSAAESYHEIITLVKADALDKRQIEGFASIIVISIKFYKVILCLNITLEFLHLVLTTVSTLLMQMTADLVNNDKTVSRVN